MSRVYTDTLCLGTLVRHDNSCPRLLVDSLYLLSNQLSIIYIKAVNLLIGLQNPGVTEKNPVFRSFVVSVVVNIAAEAIWC